MTGDRLDSWKEIASHLNRSVRTVTRWERDEGLPVHRHLHSKSGSVYAYKAELDAWWTNRGQLLEPRAVAFETARTSASRKAILAAVAGTVLVLAAAAWFNRPPPSLLPASKLVPLTTYPGVEGPPSLSPDGNQVTFEREGDIFIKQVDGEALVQLTRTGSVETSPAWSPDGRQIAFIRDGQTIRTISPLGGGERGITETVSPLLLKTMAWTPDGQSLVVSEMTSPVAASLFVISVATGQKLRLTRPPEPSIGDGWPAVSPDGTTVAFARYSQDTSASVYIVPVSGGEPRRLTADNASIFGLAWVDDGDLVFSSDRDGASRLWRVSANIAKRDVTPVDAAGGDARFPSIARHHSGGLTRLAFQRFVQNLDIRRAEILQVGTEHRTMKPSRPFIVSTRSEDHPAYSPDGTKIAFVSGRSGAQEVWVCASDASNPTRLTSMGGPIVAGPQWSPDGRRIAFFATTGAAGKYAVYVTDAEGGQASLLTRTDTEMDALPAWSRDGQFLYVTSGRSGSLQIWKMSAENGQMTQLSRGGGAEAAESPDGATVYFTKAPEIGPGLWSMPSKGGEEVRLLDFVRFGYWALARGGIYFVHFDVPADAPRPLRFFDLESRRIIDVGTLEKTVAWTNTPGFAISPDGRWVLYTSLENTEADLMLMDGVR